MKRLWPYIRSGGVVALVVVSALSASLLGTKVAQASVPPQFAHETLLSRLEADYGGSPLVLSDRGTPRLRMAILGVARADRASANVYAEPVTASVNAATISLLAVPATPVVTEPVAETTSEGAPSVEPPTAVVPVATAAASVPEVAEPAHGPLPRAPGSIESPQSSVPAASAGGGNANAGGSSNAGGGNGGR